MLRDSFIGVFEKTQQHRQAEKLRSSQEEGDAEKEVCLLSPLKKKKKKGWRPGKAAASLEVRRRTSANE